MIPAELSPFFSLPPSHALDPATVKTPNQHLLPALQGWNSTTMMHAAPETGSLFFRDTSYVMCVGITMMGLPSAGGRKYASFPPRVALCLPLPLSLPIPPTRSCRLLRRAVPLPAHTRDKLQPNSSVLGATFPGWSLKPSTSDGRFLLVHSASLDTPGPAVGGRKRIDTTGHGGGGRRRILGSRPTTGVLLRVCLSGWAWSRSFSFPFSISHSLPPGVGE